MCKREIQSSKWRYIHVQVTANMVGLPVIETGTSADVFVFIMGACKHEREREGGARGSVVERGTWSACI